MSSLVYAIVPAGARVSGRRLRTVRAGRLAAVVVDTPRRARPTRAGLRDYDNVMRDIAGQVPALLPARFNTFVDGDDEIQMVLRARAETFRAALGHVRYRVQMTLRLPASPPSGPPSRPAAGPLSSGAEYLRSRSASRQVPAPLRAAVKPWVRDELIESRGNVTTIYHLITRGSVAAYERAVDAAAADAAIRLRRSGPFPPYAFVGGW